MKAQLQNRITELNKELKKGQERFRELQTQQSQLHETMLRIEGALLVLNELLNEESSAADNKESAADADKVKPDSKVKRL